MICILDEGGNLMYLERADDTQIASIQVAQAKAQSAVGFKRPTKVFEDAVAGGRTAIVKLPGAMPIEGGIPLMLNGRVAGAIGDAVLGSRGCDYYPDPRSRSTSR